jgi:hypothetical protein
MFKVHEHSRFPDYLAIILLYQAGQNEILAVELWQVCFDFLLLSSFSM